MVDLSSMENFKPRKWNYAEFLLLEIQNRKTDFENPKQVKLAEVEKKTILETLEQMNGNKKTTTRELGISKTTLWRKLKYISL